MSYRGWFVYLGRVDESLAGNYRRYLSGSVGGLFGQVVLKSSQALLVVGLFSAVFAHRDATYGQAKYCTRLYMAVFLDHNGADKIHHFGPECYNGFKYAYLSSATQI